MAQANPYSVVVDFSGAAARNAALYFDYVVPMTSIPGRPERLSSITKVEGDEIVAHMHIETVVMLEHHRIARNLVPPFLNYEIKDAMAANKLLELRLAEESLRNLGDSDFDPSWQASYYDAWYSGIGSLLKRYPQLNAAPCFWDEDGAVPVRHDGPEELLLTIGGMELIDVSNTSWDQILEFRKDEESKRKLRRFRFFLQKSYQGKDRSFIEDDLQTRLEDYEATVRKWGFDKGQATLSALYESTTVASLAVLLSVFFETLAPTALQATLGAVGISAAIGRLILSLQRCRYGLEEFRRQSEVSYIFKAKEKLAR